MPTKSLSNTTGPPESPYKNTLNRLTLNQLFRMLKNQWTFTYATNACTGWTRCAQMALMNFTSEYLDAFFLRNGRYIENLQIIWHWTILLEDQNLQECSKQSKLRLRVIDLNWKHTDNFPHPLTWRLEPGGTCSTEYLIGFTFSVNSMVCWT